jgi:hypothetical protein
MILADSESYDYPHIDWRCKECGAVYCYAGYPPETRCIEGHAAGWKPHPDQIKKYIEVLDSQGSMDSNWIVICGDGPAPLMAPVEAIGHEYGWDFLITESIDSPRRKVRWHPDDFVIEWKQPDSEYDTYSDVYHVEVVEAQTAESEPDLSGALIND